MSAPLQPAKPQYERAIRCLTMLYQERGLAEALRELVPHKQTWLFTRGLIRLEVHPVTALNGKTDGRLLVLTDGFEQVAIGVALDAVEAGIHVVDVQTRSLDTLKDPPVTPEEVEAAKERLVYGLVEQFAMRWPPTKELQACSFTRLGSNVQ